MDRFRELETFVAVVESGSFVKAAEKLLISKSVASRIVQDLEERLAGRLLQRTTRRLSLTDAGQAYYERCKQILDELAEADGAVGMSSTKAVGLLKVSVPLTFGAMHLAGHWGRFLQLHPQVNLDVSMSDRHVDLIGEGYDLAIRITFQQLDSSLVTRKLASSRVVMSAAREYLDRAGTPESWEDLARHEFIGYSYLSTGDTWKLASSEQHKGLRTHPRLRVDNGDTCRLAALSGLGIILQPTFIIGADLQAGKLIEILPEWHSDEVSIYAVYPARKHLSGKVRALVDYLTEAFKTAEWNSLNK